MLNVCFNCGEYRADKFIDPEGPYAICPVCGHKQSFLQLPLLIVSGASGAGKSTICQTLTGQLANVVLLDSDILWRPEFNQPESKYRDFFETWLRVCKNISQSGRPVVLFGAGIGVPENMEPCIERRYFSRLHYLALMCKPETQIRRLQERPWWRKADDPAFLAAQVNFNRWFREKGSTTTPVIELLDTTEAAIPETAHRVTVWINSKLNCQGTLPGG